MFTSLKGKLTDWFQRGQIVRNLEVFQDIIIISLCISLFCVMVLRLVDLFIHFFQPLEVRQVTSDILFILILVELFRLLADYLQEHRISVGAAVEISIVSSLREVILKGVLEVKSEQLVGISLFLVVLGALFVILPWMSKLLESMIPTHK
ncbi:MAG: phosphate-starvation-inducible PsiE family protein [Calothrix sp. FI2-JRJ7]|jgi:uncharacterized membrane protein (DUF373 family)|nr:phosphate-starvation-inducible PsiE family protein [Calothrix sp. FI2-JRJ7]